MTNQNCPLSNLEKKNKTFRKLVVIIGHWSLVIGVLFGALPADAAIVPDCTGVAQGNTRACTVSDIFVLLVNIYNFLLGLAAFVAFLFIVLAGIKMFIYHWSEHPEQELEGAKFTLTRAIWGLVIVATAFLVVNTLLVIFGVQADTAFGRLLSTWFNFQI